VIGHLPAAINLHNGNVARHQHMFSLTRLPLGKHRGVLYHPNFIGTFGSALIGKRRHGLPNALVFH
jgi:hypothetical protein